MEYVKLTDTVNKDKLLRFTGSAWEEYNIATGRWVISVLIYTYLDPSSPFFELYKDITEAEAAEIIMTQTNTWKNVWFSAQAAIHEYKNLKSPIADMPYSEYAVWLSDYAEDEYQRVLYALSGIDLLPNRKAVLAKLKLPENLQADVLQYHDTKRDNTLFQESKYALRNAIQRELELLVSRKDLEDEKAILRRKARLDAGFSPAEAYANIRI